MKGDLRPSSARYWQNLVNFNLYGDPPLSLFPALVWESVGVFGLLLSR